jgi:2-oxoisovalerate dehydrogenase E1 component alpha subunit
MVRLCKKVAKQVAKQVEGPMERRNAPKFSVPAAHSRPGQRPDFSYLRIDPPGTLDKPDIMTPCEGMESHARGLIGVLNNEHKAVGAWDPGLDAETLRDALAHMVTTRAFDDRLGKVQRQGKLSFYMKSTGEEAVAVGQGLALRADDMLFPSYRQQGLQIVRGRPLLEMMCHCLSNTRDNCKGRQMPVMYSWREGNLFSISGNLGTQFSQAVGWAMASGIRGEDSVAAAWVGEGTSAEADFHYALTFASVYQAPVILNVVNNQWAISSFQGIAGGERTSFASRGLGYGVPGLRVDGNDLLAVFAATRWAADRARSGGGATLIELFTYRADAHSTSDDPSKYRPREESHSWPLGDPIERLKSHLIGLGEWSEGQQKILEKEARDRVAKTYKEAESYGTISSPPRLSLHTMFEDVYRDQPQHLRRQRQQLGV